MSPSLRALPTNSIRLRRDTPLRPDSASRENRRAKLTGRQPGRVTPCPGPRLLLLPPQRRTMFPPLPRAPTLRRLFWITVLQGYHPRFLVRTLLPLIPARTQSNLWRPRVHTIFPLPRPPRRSRERPRRHPLLPGDRIASRRRLPRLPCRERMRHPRLLPKARIMSLLPHPPLRSRGRLRPLRSPRRGPMGYHPPLPQRLCRERIPHPRLLPQGPIMCPVPLPPRRSRGRLSPPRSLRRGHTRCPHPLPRDQAPLSRHSLHGQGDRIMRFPMPAPLRRQ